MTLSCLTHTKRTSTSRPSAPPVYTDTVWCGDRSGSMGSMGRSPQEGARGFLEEHKKMAMDLKCKNGYFVEFTTFDDIANTYYDGDAQKIQERDLAIAESAMVPRGMTRFYDTAIECIGRQQDRIDAIFQTFPKNVQKLIKGEKWYTCVFVTFTDGLDNSSLSDKTDLNKCIAEHRKTYDATCLFLAANQNADTVGREMGFESSECLQMGSDRRSSKMALKSATSASLRTVTGESSCFTQCERQSSCNATENLMFSNTVATPMGAAGLVTNSPPAPQTPKLNRTGHLHARFQQLRTQHGGYNLYQ
jgi:hypothetical protein